MSFVKCPGLFQVSLELKKRIRWMDLVYLRVQQTTTFSYTSLEVCIVSCFCRSEAQATFSIRKVHDVY